MTRVLLVTNDFPPRRGGIQSYLEQFVGEPADELLEIGLDAATAGRKVIGDQ